MKKQEYLKLLKEVARANEAYEQGEPLISDYDYDRMMQGLKAAEDTEGIEAFFITADGRHVSTEGMRFKEE